MLAEKKRNYRNLYPLMTYSRIIRKSLLRGPTSAIDRPPPKMIGLRAQSASNNSRRASERMGGGSKINLTGGYLSPAPAASPGTTSPSLKGSNPSLAPPSSPSLSSRASSGADSDSDKSNSRESDASNRDSELAEGRARLGTLAEAPPNKAQPAAPQGNKPRKTLKEYHFEKQLGEGAYGVVKLATELATGRKVAVKILEKNHIVKEKKVEWVEREKTLLDKLRHPNIITLYSTFQDHHFLYFVLELCPGGEFLKVIQQHGGLAVSCGKYYAAEITSAMEYLHSMGVVHRDLKPENLLLTADNHIKLIDFGTAKEIGTDPRARTTSFCGTAEYLSPELLNTKDNTGYGLMSDIWALGCVIFQICSGKPPFRAKVPLLIFQKIQARELVFPEGFPPVARGLVEGLLMLEPERRIHYPEIKNNPFFSGVQWAQLNTFPSPPFRSPDIPILWPPPGPDEVFEQQSPEERAEQEKLAARQAKLEEQKSSPWAKFLQGDELIVETGLVNKKKGLFSRRRQLFVTDAPRIFYVDPEKMMHMGDIPWTRDIFPEIKDNRHFNIHTPNRIYILDDVNSSSHRWADAINSLKKAQQEKEREKKERELLQKAQQKILESDAGYSEM